MGLRGPGANKKIVKFTRKRKTPKTPTSRADDVIRFIEQFKVTKGILVGEKFRVRDFQKRVITAWYKVNSIGIRIVRTGLLTLGRKNGKTTLIAALAAAHLVGPEAEPRGEIVAGAADRDQSGIIFEELEAMLESKPMLRAKCNVKRHEKVIENLENGSKFRALSSDAKKAHGMSPSVVILDELAQWGDGIGRRLYNALTTSQGGRKEPLLLVIGTQAENDQAIMSQLIDYARSVNQGDIEDPTFAGFIYETEEDADIFDEKNWQASNPALNDFRSLEDMRMLAKKAKRIPAEQSSFRNLYLNQRVAAEERWLSSSEWKSRIDKNINLDDLAGATCVAGLDMSSVRDLTAFALYFPAKSVVAVWSFCPKENLKIREEQDRVPYTLWARQGHIEAIPGKAVNKKRIAHRLSEICEKFSPLCIAFDRWGIAELQQIIADEGLKLPEFVEFGQGYKSMSPAVKAFEERVIDERIFTPVNPCLTWAISNCAITRDAADNKKLDKEKSRERIDPAVACVMAVGQAVQMELETSSIYERREMIVI